MSVFRARFFAQHAERLDGQGTGPKVGTELSLSSQDSHHALRVLRLKSGDECEVVVGNDVYAAWVSNIEAPVRVVLKERLAGCEAGAVYRVRVGMVQALTRPAQTDQLLEKGTEVGTSFFVLVPAAGSIQLPVAARTARLQRWRRIVVEAAKQSKQVAIPTVEVAESVREVLETLTAEGTISLLLEPSADLSLREVLEGGSLARSGLERPSVALWIGPESGWTDPELEQFGQAGVKAARLGRAVLRAETAGPVAVAVTRLVLRDW